MNEETKAPSLITKWVETKDYRVVIVTPSNLQEFYMNLTDYQLRYYFYKILVVDLDRAG